MSKWIIGDIHGCFDTFMALIKKLPKDAEIVLVGDLIDRGPKSKEVVQYVIDNKIDCVRGNHEQMMIDEPSYWSLNGGHQTLVSYSDEPIGLKFLKLDIDLFMKHSRWMDTLPIYLEYPEVKNEDGRHLVVSHSILHNVWKHRNSEDKQKYAQFVNTATWSRDFAVKDNPEIFNVIGHTPQEHEAKIKKIYANVDTGCCFKQIGFGFMTALKFPEMELITQENIDEVTF